MQITTSGAWLDMWATFVSSKPRFYLNVDSIKSLVIKMVMKQIPPPPTPPTLRYPFHCLLYLMRILNNVFNKD